MKVKSTSGRCVLSRRGFFKIGGGVLAGSMVAGCTISRKEESEKIKRYKTLGMTGFKVSDIALGCGPVKDANVVRYAYDRGINYFDTAEGYGNGASEKAIGRAMKYMDRKKIWITTKLRITDEDSENRIIDRVRRSLERLNTDYIDSLYIWGVTDAKLLNHKGFHSAARLLKAEGRLKHIGVSSHGPRRKGQDSMEKVLCSAAEDGRFDLLLMVYNFMNREEAEKIIAVCKKRGVGTTAMKTRPGVLEVESFNPENPTDRQSETIERMMKRGMSREKAVERIKKMIEQQQETLKKTESFIKKYGIKSKDQLDRVSVQWVLNNPDMDTVCIGMADFESIDKYIPLSGTSLSFESKMFLKDFELAYNNLYCRHGCTICTENCSYDLPVSTIMRYSYYFKIQGREKYAMEKYAGLGKLNGSLCETCNAPCEVKCPYGVAIQSNLLAAHSILSFV